MVTFETQCFEGDYRYIFTGNRLEKMITHCNYPFEKRVVIINNVNDRALVASLADTYIARGIIDAYYFAEDYATAALAHFSITKESFNGGYYYSIAEFVGIYLCDTPYLLHCTTDAYIEQPNTSQWVTEGIARMKADPAVVCVNPFWAPRVPVLTDGFQSEESDWMIDCGFSDQCHLIPMNVFKGKIYGESHRLAARYPSYTGESIEKRIFSYMKNHTLLRLTNKHIYYTHKNFPRRGWKPFTQSILAYGKQIARSTGLFDKKLLAKHHASQRAKVKVYDICTFFNEYDLLEMRLNILDPYVDYFVIVEATETFSGQPKPLYYAEQKERFKKWEHKIIHHVTTDTPRDEDELRERLLGTNLSALDREIITNTLTSDNVPKGAVHWLKEFYQKESIKKALIGLEDEDICYVGDVDEIWNPETLIDYEKDRIYKLRQLAYAYYINNRSSEPWAGTLMTKYKHIKYACLNHLRTKSKTSYTYVKNAGWHFTNMGGADQIRKKLESYGHQEFNTSSIKSDIETKIKNNTDFIGRRFTFWKDEKDLPAYIINNKERYHYLFK